MKRPELTRILEAVADAETVLVTSEPYPDGDAIATELVFEHVIRHAFDGQKDVTLVNEKGCPRKYQFLHGSEKVVTPDTLERKHFDVGIVVDGGVERTGSVRPIFDACETRIYVDHHKMGSQVTYDVSLSVPESSSTVELLFPYFENDDLSIPLTKEISEAIYLGIIFDTGSFNYSLTNAETHRIAARLMETGIDHAMIAEKAILTQEFSEIKLLGKVLGSARRNEEEDILWGIVTADILDEYDVHTEDFNKIITNLCFVEGVEVAILLREIGEERFKLSLRSRGKVDVAVAARSLDEQGGGHMRAAGCTLTGTLDAVLKATLEEIESHLRGEKRITSVG